MARSKGRTAKAKTKTDNIRRRPRNPVAAIKWPADTVVPDSGNLKEVSYYAQIMTEITHPFSYFNMEMNLVRCDRAISVNPGRYEAHFTKGNVYSECEMYEEAFSCYRAALERNPGIADLYELCFDTLNNLSKKAEASRYLYEAVRNTDDPRSIFLLCSYFFNSDQKEMAIELAKGLTESDFHSSMAHRDLADMLKDMNRIEEAITHYGHAIEAGMDNSETQYVKGLCLAEINRHADALECFEAAIAWDPADRTIYPVAADSLDELGRHKEAAKARKEYERLFKVDFKRIQNELKEDRKRIVLDNAAAMRIRRMKEYEAKNRS